MIWRHGPEQLAEDAELYAYHQALERGEVQAEEPIELASEAELDEALRWVNRQLQDLLVHESRGDYNQSHVAAYRADYTAMQTTLLDEINRRKELNDRS